MKIRLLLALVGLAISFAFPIFAQQKAATLSEQDRQQLGALHKKWDEAENNNDAAALAALFTEDAAFVTDKRPVSGREAIKQWFADDFREWRHSNHIHKLNSISARIIGTAGNEFWSTGEFEQTFQAGNASPLRISGHFLNILVREGDALKVKVDTANFTGPPVPAETK